MESDRSWTEIFDSLVVMATGLGLLTFVLFPFAVPMLGLTIVVMLVLALPLVALAAVAAMLTGVWLGIRAAARRIAGSGAGQPLP